MKTSTRVLASIIAFLICYVFIFFPLAFMTKDMEKGTVHIISLISAALIGLFIWLLTKNTSKKFVGKVFITAIVIGAIGFAIGFIGPLIITPDENLGPLLGIFKTGPLSFVFGLIAGGLYWKLKDNKATKSILNK